MKGLLREIEMEMMNTDVLSGLVKLQARGKKEEMTNRNNDALKKK